ncbi:hypothetical protein [Iodobacter fluviatilis]|uniref:Lipoprotein n=1 Tax=Iodobacter fluviatilis TaxID=537 RepID=A0A377Q2X9_9NEIS|nr:hypothetical protein [Iodobacter fluviatilis]TCU90527.1 hypothetical protein EV682_101561 [Iodobacter fluviatilis]STQ89554.1 Uncharacterised protein [Iodobacter fluviatilis]
MQANKIKLLILILALYGCEKKFDHATEEPEPEVISFYSIKDGRIIIKKAVRDFEIRQILINKKGEQIEWLATCKSICPMDKDLVVENHMSGYEIEGAMMRAINDDEEFNIRLAIDVGAKHVVGSTAQKNNSSN